MFRLIIFLVVAALLALGAHWIVEHPDVIHLEVQGQPLKIHHTVAIVAAIAIGAVVLYELFRVLRWLPERIRSSRQSSQKIRGLQELADGLVAVAAGDLGSAKAHHRTAEKLLPNTGAVTFLSAQTAQLEGKEDVAHLKFHQMLRTQDTELLGLRGLLAQSMKTGDQKEALELARRAYRRNPSVPWVLTTLFELLARDEQWNEALGIVSEMGNRGVISDAEMKRRRAILYHMAAKKALAEDRIDEALSQERKAVANGPAFVPAVVTAADLSVRQGRRRNAAKMIEDAWRVAPHPDLAKAFARLEDKETPAQRVQRFQFRLSGLQANNLETHVALADLALQARDFDLARAELEKAMSLEPTARVYRMMADLERAQGNAAKAQDWLSRALDAPPDRAWICEDTNEVLSEWAPFGSGGRFDSVQWAQPMRVATYMNADADSFLAGEAETVDVSPKPAQGTQGAPAPA
ncbi:MAG: heme biosynthesis HemY N-terminal domain-containing protein [Geminicoccaceae bacterium]